MEKGERGKEAAKVTALYEQREIYDRNGGGE